MADSFSVVTQLRSVRVIGPTQVVDVELVGFVTHPTEIYAEYPVPLDLWRDGNVAELFGTITGAVGWIPYAGKVLKAPVHRIEQKVTHALGTAEEAFDRRIGTSFH